MIDMTNDGMKAAVYYVNGSPSVLRYENVPIPILGANDVLIRVESISIEGGDILTRKLVAPPAPPHIVGYQAAGVVIKTGAEARRFAVGQRVAACNWAGSHAELFAVPEHYVYPVPDDLDIKIASTVPVTFGTADDALFEFGRLRAGETVLINGGAGGVGLAAIQLAKAMGARVIATASTDERLSRLYEFGIDDGINYKTTDLVSKALKLTGDRGVDLLVDLAGGSGATILAHAVRYRGRFAVVGAASGDLPTFGFMDIVARSLTMYGISFGQEMHLDRVHTMLDGHMRSAAEGRLRMPIDQSFPLASAAAAHEYVQVGHPFGRVVMIP